MTKPSKTIKKYSFQKVLNCFQGILNDYIEIGLSLHSFSMPKRVFYLKPVALKPKVLAEYMKHLFFF